MDGITDPVFRKIILEQRRPDVFFTEFTNCEAILEAGEKVIKQRLGFDPKEQPIVAQIWGKNPESFKKVAKIIKDLGFAGIDINMGCPVRIVLKNGTCSALIRNPSLAGEIIKATKKGSGGLPVSVKTRIGFEKSNLDEWLGFLLKQDLAAVSIHLRSVRELSKVPAHWELIPEIIALRDKIAPDTLIIGNGDIKDLGEVKEKYKQYKCEGFMIGRGILTNPWVFNPKINPEKVSIKERLKLFLHHIELFEKSGNPYFEILKKYCKIYINNFPEASTIREKIMQIKSLDEMKNAVEMVLETY